MSDKLTYEDIVDIANDPGVTPTSCYPLEATIELARLLGAAQAKIDELMLEYCSDEMTADQIANWERHQVPVTEEEMDELAKALEP
jgi:hypothetical protein